MIIAIVGLVALLVGYFSRELREILRRIELALNVLIRRKDEVEAEKLAKRKGMSFGDPMSMADLAEMEDEERIAAINKDM